MYNIGAFEVENWVDLTDFITNQLQIKMPERQEEVRTAVLPA